MATRVFSDEELEALRSFPAIGKDEQLTGDPAWRERALGWIDGYHDGHGHGPSWRTFWREPSLWPEDATLSLLNTVMRQLGEGGHLAGTKTPFGLRRR
ncbi:hypothetical protein ACGFYQ_38190 [Streptomyces sp. NPDC048258]|uniref:hypothetical protein n=1 Tax=Streptomyces sp. NPDC048258 TaxID=3365527 RepID=UPI00371B44E3